MAEAEIEELLDFDGSDYEFGSDEGAGEEEDVDYRVVGEDASMGQDDAADPVEGQAMGMDSLEISGSVEPQREPDRAIERGRRMPESRSTRHSSKTDLEDGEFFDMAPMVNSKKQAEHGVVKDGKLSRKQHSNETMRALSDREAERNTGSRQDRKRRREHDYERHQYSSPRSRKQPHERYTGRYDRPHGGRYDRVGDFPDSRIRGPPFYRPNYSPGIMGPGRPDMNHVRACTAGLEIFSPAQLQELLNQEHMLRSQQMLHLARLGIRPPPGQPMYPLMGPNDFRPPLQPMGSDITSRMNFMGGPLGVQGPRSCYPPTGRGPGILGGAGAFGFARPPRNEALALGSGRVQPRPSTANAQVENGKHPGRSVPSTKHEQDSPRRNDRDREPESRSKRTASTFDARLERDNREKCSKGSDPAGNLIHLGGPVQKSRVLTVGGLLENTPMSTVADAFEKQGKILDFRKNQTGDVFTITFSSVQEAVSAKRHLHRSMLAGRQITVEYAVV